jgi:hypothetical protein
MDGMEKTPEMDEGLGDMVLHVLDDLPARGV